MNRFSRCSKSPDFGPINKSNFKHSPKSRDFGEQGLDEKKLAEETLKYILAIQNTYFECTLFQKILDPRIKYEDLDQHIEFLKERLSHLEFFVDHTDVTFDNKISGYSQYKYVEGLKIDDSWVITDLILLYSKFKIFQKKYFGQTKKRSIIMRPLLVLIVLKRNWYQKPKCLRH